MGIIFDTSIIIPIEKLSSEQTIDELISERQSDLFGISVITVSELLHGIHRANTEIRKIKRQAFVDKILDFFPIYNFDSNMAKIYASIWANIIRKGDYLGAHDLIIASTAISLGFSVATLNIKDFKKVEGLTIEKLELSN